MDKYHKIALGVEIVGVIVILGAIILEIRQSASIYLICVTIGAMLIAFGSLLRKTAILHARASVWWWRGTIAAFTFGVILAVGGIIIEFIVRDPTGLIMIVLSTLGLGGAGVFATLGAKHEAEELKSQELESKAQESKVQ